MIDMIDMIEMVMMISTRLKPWSKGRFRRRERVRLRSARAQRCLLLHRTPVLS